jgi:chorismate synthase
LSLVPGSEVRDPLTQFGPASNRHGGVLGGMSSGTRLFAKIHFHAPTSIPQPIESARQSDGTKEIIVVGGRHDSFPLPRAVPMVEAMAMITIVDLLARAGALPSQIK